MRPIDVTLNPIGYVEHDTPDAEVAKARRNLESRISILPAWRDAIQGLEEYSHVFVLFWMDRVPQDACHQLVHPRGDQQIPKTGVLATRTRNRPNPIGLAVVEVLDVNDLIVTVKKLDAFSGTPIIDIKPYDDYDRVSDPRVPDWWAKRCRS